MTALLLQRVDPWTTSSGAPRHRSGAPATGPVPLPSRPSGRRDRRAAAGRSPSDDAGAGTDAIFWRSWTRVLGAWWPSWSDWSSVLASGERVVPDISQTRPHRPFPVGAEAPPGERRLARVPC